ncbi:hypothetical protein [Herbaspirillum sp. alder98]|uniref:hypothetical protein n=1 Tax=Herbaspirillum sp. alder98 TaxID=2913096 RepID=UPI001CD8AF25|nr:hypothetical protein [Herbaspirillum sp. alder98]MCA1324930.1 hypothetical protein [Herbaspirillum sp. alder98]
MDITRPHLKPAPQPTAKRPHKDLQQQAGVTRQRNNASDDADRDRLRQSQADRQSDAI